MKLTPYATALKAGKELVTEMMVPLRVNRARKQAELELCKLDEEYASKQTALHEQCCKEELNFNKIIELQDALGLLDRRRNQFRAIIDEMFPAETAAK